MPPALTGHDAPGSDVLSITTLLGPMDVSSRDIVAFPSGLPGFERSTRFAIVRAPEIAPLSLLQAVEGEPASFFVVDPRRLIPEYRGTLSDADRSRLGASDEASLVWLAIVLFDETEQGFVNLRAPIVINPGPKIGCQVLPHHSAYALRHPLVPE